MKWVPLNFGLLKSPLNWITILLMVYIGWLALREAMKLVGIGADNTCGCMQSLFPVPQSSLNSSES